MKLVNLVFISLFLQLILIAGCSVTSLLKEEAPQFSNEITLPEIEVETLRQKNSNFPSYKIIRSSNVISVVSDCSAMSSIKSIHQLISESVESYKVIEEKSQNLKQTKALYKKTSGTVDDRQIEIHSLSFKHKNCVYLSSLSGSADKNLSSLSQDFTVWQNFNDQIEFKK